MNAVVPIAPGSLGAALPLSTATDQFALNAMAATTQRAYRSDWRAFLAWCDDQGLVPLPASPETVARHLAACAMRGLSVSSIGRRLAAIKYAHRLKELELPTASERVRTVLAGIRRTCGAPPDRKAPVTAERLTELLKHCPPGLRGIRDRALLALGFAGAFRRSELVALRVEDLEETPDGFHITIRHSKTDKTHTGQSIAIPRGFRLRPVEAVQTWLAASGITEGLVFRQVIRRKIDGVATDLLAGPLSGHAVAEVVKRYCIRAGLDPASYSGHSLRAGYVTSAVEVNAPLLKICEQTRHRDLSMIRIYSRRVDLFREHSGAAFL